MSDDHDFALEADGPEPRPEPEATPPPDPKVVIVYRSRGLPAVLLPPLLLLIAGVGIVSYRRQTPIRWQARTPQQARPAAAAPPRSITVDSPSTGTATDPLIVRIETKPDLASPPPDLASVVGSQPILGAQGPFSDRLDIPTPPTEPTADAPEAEAEARNETKTEKAGPPPPPEPAAAAPAPAVAQPPRQVEPPTVTKEQVLEDIQREAQRKEAERQRLEELKPRLRQFEVAEMHRKAEESRASFHNALRNVLRTPGLERGQAIAALCDEYGRSTPAYVEKQVLRLLRTSYARMGHRAKVEMMRTWGWPEPKILDYLAHDFDLMIGARGGPRSKDDVRVWAARLLLSLPPTPRPVAEAGKPETAPAH